MELDYKDGMPDLAEAPKEKPVRPTFDSFAGVPMDKRHNFKIENEGIGVGNLTKNLASKSWMQGFLLNRITQNFGIFWRAKG